MQRCNFSILGMLFISTLGAAESETKPAPAAQPQECPCITAAKELGVSGERLDAFIKLSENLGRSLDAIDQTQDMKDLAARIELAKKDKDEKQRAELGAAQMKLYRPVVAAYHTKAKEFLGAEVWEKFNAKLPRFFKL